MINVNWNEYKFIDYLNVKEIEIKKLPNGVNISTMCASCKLNTIINVKTIEKYLPLNQEDILCVKLDKEHLRTLIPKKAKNKRANNVPVKKTNHFYNQITVVVRIGNGPIEDFDKEQKINLKLFKNGSVQMSGCKSILSINIVLNKLLNKLRQIRAIKEGNTISELKFIESPEKMAILNFKIDMINSNYKVNIQIDRSKLFSLLMKKKVKSSYEPCIRACVIIKYVPEIDNVEEREISIFIFQKGNIIITGAKKESHIVAAYKYINNILLVHYEDIYKKDETEEEDLILALYENIMKDVKIGLITL